MMVMVVMMSRIDYDRSNGGVRTGVIHDLRRVVRNDRGIIGGAIAVAVSVVITAVRGSCGARSECTNTDGGKHQSSQ